MEFILTGQGDQVMTRTTPAQFFQSPAPSGDDFRREGPLSRKTNKPREVARTRMIRPPRTEPEEGGTSRKKVKCFR